MKTLTASIVAAMLFAVPVAAAGPSASASFDETEQSCDSRSDADYWDFEYNYTRPDGTQVGGHERYYYDDYRWECREHYTLAGATAEDDQGTLVGAEVGRDEGQESQRRFWSSDGQFWEVHPDGSREVVYEYSNSGHHDAYSDHESTFARVDILDDSAGASTGCSYAHNSGWTSREDRAYWNSASSSACREGASADVGGRDIFVGRSSGCGDSSSTSGTWESSTEFSQGECNEFVGASAGDERAGYGSTSRCQEYSTYGNNEWNGTFYEGHYRDTDCSSFTGLEGPAGARAGTRSTHWSWSYTEYRNGELVGEDSNSGSSHELYVATSMTDPISPSVPVLP